MTSPLDCISNVVDTTRVQFYAAILGANPSQGARSPKLWNAAFAKLGISGEMVPMDVAPEKLGALVDALREDARFIGGAVAMPYKTAIIPYLDRVDKQAQAIGAINCIYRSAEGLVGCNTDGAGALWSLEQSVGSIKGKSVLAIGCGGAGVAVATHIAYALGASGTLLLANRDPQKAAYLQKKLEGVCAVRVVPTPPSEADLKDAQIVVNCTSLGFGPILEADGRAQSQRFYTPLALADINPSVPAGPNAEARYCAAASAEIGANMAASLRLLSVACPEVVMDIVYQPQITALLALASMFGAKTVNGLGMNLEQAVIAFDKATAGVGLRSSDVNVVRQAMQEL
ncbi:shikimate dehydrogenase [Desulfovibrio mangrovi]|uniref:shikimate dehydrogenase family protein n=1 Tax=Desulfovibrio mangrovi TaxID=2976983 RepID=UPI002247DBDF|nr:shikimate dehydrogenase [Desulfovibrio mangrovi]UZP66656.1 shikimate dehydrogenase [Desulfovibrio mangrovi]